MNQVEMALRGEVPFCRFPYDEDWPHAARMVYKALEWFRRNRPEVTITDRLIAGFCGIKRRCVQKGLLQLQLLKVIERIRTGGGRVIKFLLRFATKPKPEKKSHGPKPAFGSGGPKPAFGSEGRQAPKTTPAEEAAKNLESARTLLDALQVKGWTIEWNDANSLIPKRVRPDAPDLTQDELWMMRYLKVSCQELLAASRPARE